MTPKTSLPAKPTKRTSAKRTPADVLAAATSAPDAALIPTAQAAALLGLSVESVYVLVARGLLPAFRLTPRAVRFRKAAVLAYLDSTRTDRE